MSRILITYDCYDGCNQTDTTKVISVLSACNKEHVFFHKPEAQISKKDLELADILVLIRPTSLHALNLAKSARQAGIFLVVMYDDDLINIPRGPFYSHFHWRRGYAKRTLARSQLFLCPNALLLSDYKKYMKTPRAIFFPPCVTRIEQRFAPVSPLKKPLRVLYAASQDHKHFFDSLIGPAIKPLFEHYPNAFEFTFLGLKPDLSLFPKDATVRCFPPVPYDQFIEFLKNGAFDIGLAPLIETPFSSRKGVVKYIDYSVVGALGIFHMANGLN